MEGESLAEICMYVADEDLYKTVLIYPLLPGLAI